MNELPPDLPRLHTLETYLQLQLQAVRSRIAEIETAAPTTPATLPAEATPGWWRLQPNRAGRGGGILHRGDCPHAGGARLSRAEALIALSEPGVEMCEQCQPQKALAA